MYKNIIFLIIFLKKFVKRKILIQIRSHFNTLKIGFYTSSGFNARVKQLSNI